jgi:acyl CoA:acetate/3-ketoacid CoA transferase beta subunit
MAEMSGCCGTAAEDSGDIRESVRARYAAAARSSAQGSVLSLGCGVPTAVADLREGETVLDSAPGPAPTCSSAPGASGPPARPSGST